jgi:probable rRNA maturation factor
VRTINSPKLVTPAQAGAQGIKQDLSTAQSPAPVTFRMWPWAPACAGVIRRGGELLKSPALSSRTIDCLYHSSLWVKCLKEEDIAGVIDAAADLLNIHVPFEMTVVLADNAFIQELNAQYRGKDKPTDVLSFPQENLSKGHELSIENLNLGDIILSYETIERDASSQEKSLVHHSLHMVVHGFLHLMGYDHQSNEDAEEMEAVEVAVLAECGIANPYE